MNNNNNFNNGNSGDAQNAQILSIISIILGLLACIPFTGFGILAAALGIVLGVVAKNMYSKSGLPSGLAVAGIGISTIGIILSIVFAIICNTLSCIGSIFGCG